MTDSAAVAEFFARHSEVEHPYLREARLAFEQERNSATVKAHASEQVTTDNLLATYEHRLHILELRTEPRWRSLTEDVRALCTKFAEHPGELVRVCSIRSTDGPVYVLFETRSGRFMGALRHSPTPEENALGAP